MLPSRPFPTHILKPSPVSIILCFVSERPVKAQVISRTLGVLDERV